MSQTTALAGTDRQLEKRVTMFVALGIIFAPLNSTMIAVALPLKLKDDDVPMAEAEFMISGESVELTKLEAEQMAQTMKNEKEQMKMQKDQMEQQQEQEAAAQQQEGEQEEQLDAEEGSPLMEDVGPEGSGQQQVALGDPDHPSEQHCRVSYYCGSVERVRDNNQRLDRLFVIIAVASVGSMVVALGLNSRRGEGSARAG